MRIVHFTPQIKVISNVTSPMVWSRTVLWNSLLKWFEYVGNIKPRPFNRKAKSAGWSRPGRWRWLRFRRSIPYLTATTAGKRRPPCGGHSQSESKLTVARWKRYAANTSNEKQKLILRRQVSSSSWLAARGKC